MNEIKHPEYIPVHILLILGAFFMLFPFVWMISASFKSNDEIIKSSTEKIVLLPDSIRPSFLNDSDDKKRIEERKAKDKAWEEEDYKIKLIQDQILATTGLSLADITKKINEHNQSQKSSSKDATWLEEEERIEFLQNLVKTSVGLSIQDINKKILDHSKKKPFEWWDNYKDALKAQPFYRFFLNTLFVSITVTAVSLFFASLAAYAFAFFNFPGKNIVFLMILGTMMLPQQALLIPNYIMLSKMHWINTYLALTVPWLASAYAVFFLRQFFMQLPKDLFEAAIIDGCTRFGFYWRVALPLCKPSLVTMGVFSFLSNWNAFVWPLIVTNDTNLRVIQVGLSYFSSDAGNEWGQLMAASTMTILPLVIMYFFAQKQFVESSATSGMKE